MPTKTVASCFGPHMQVMLDPQLSLLDSITPLFSHTTVQTPLFTLHCFDFTV